MVKRYATHDARKEAKSRARDGRKLVLSVQFAQARATSFARAWKRLWVWVGERVVRDATVHRER